MKKLLILFLSLALFLPSFAAAEEVSILPAEEASTLMEGELLPEGELPEACASEAPTLPEMTPIPRRHRKTHSARQATCSSSGWAVNPSRKALIPIM